MRAFGGAMTPEGVPVHAAGPSLTVVPFQAHQSHPTVCSIKLNFPSIFNGLLIDKDWTIAFQAPSAGGEEESLTCCLQGYCIDKTLCYCELITWSPRASLGSPHFTATTDRFRGNAVPRRMKECL